MTASIHNDDLTLTVDTFGAEPVSLLNKAGEEMLWQADPSVWKRHAPILFPWTGKLPGGSFLHNGREYKGGQHGFARDLEHSLVRAEGSEMVLELKAGEQTRDLFPFDFTLTSTFRLEGRTVHHTLTVTNNGAEPMPFGIGYHPAFQVPFDSNHNTMDYEFRFEGKESPMIIGGSSAGLLNGRCEYVWKNVDSIPLTDSLFANGSYCMAGVNSATLGIYEKDTGRNVTCSIAGYPYTLIWSAPTDKIRFVCIEPWQSLPGEENGSKEWTDRAAAATLDRGERYEITLSTRFDR